tara:strand:+ start:1554 stop:2276 length:723 start_codon:yes stop_codon:yes gene_type:complete
VSNGFFKELEDALDNEWISMQDICAIFVGFCPLEPYQSNFGGPDINRRYKRIADGEEVKPSEADFKEMRHYLDKWSLSDFDIQSNSRYPNKIDVNDTVISVRFAFKVGLGFRPLDERICNLYDAAVDAGILPVEPSVPVEELIKQVTPAPKLSQSPLQDYLIKITKYESDLTAGKLFARWEKEKPYCINEIIPDKNEPKSYFLNYRVKFTTHSQKVIESDYDALESAINRAKKFNNKSAK